jgi:hypothetical protein
MSNGLVSGKQIKNTTLGLTKLDLSGSQGVYIYATGSSLGSYDLPSGPHSYVNKQYADSLAAGLDPKASVELAAVSNISPFGTSVFIDGITASVIGARVLLTGQTSAVNNGIYTVSSGSWSRATDSDGSAYGDVSLGNFTFVEKGASYSGTGWVLYGTNDSLGTGATISVGVDTQLWTLFSGAGSFVWGNGLKSSGNTISISLAPSSGLAFLSGQLEVSAGTGITVGASVSISNTGVIANTYGSATQVDSVTFNSQGQAISATAVSISIPSGQINNFTSSVVSLVESGSGISVTSGSGGATVSVLLAKGVTFSNNYLFADASTILTTAGLSNSNIGTNSTIQSAFNALDNAIANVAAQQMLAIDNTPTGTFLSGVNSPMNVLGYTFSTRSDGAASIYINGVYVTPNSSTSSPAYFSTNGGLSGSTSVLTNSVLYINPFVLGYNIDPTDDIIVTYLTKLP